MGVFHLELPKDLRIQNVKKVWHVHMTVSKRKIRKVPLILCPCGVRTQLLSSRVFVGARQSAMVGKLMFESSLAVKLASVVESL